MSVSINDFVGSWTVEYTCGKQPWLQQGWVILIGTGSAFGDEEPFLTDNNAAVGVGFAVLDAEGKKVELSTEINISPEPLALILDGSQLRWAGFVDRVPLRIYVSASEALLLAEGGEIRDVALYGSTVLGDPDQVGVWGGSGTPGGGGGGY